MVRCNSLGCLSYVSVSGQARKVAAHESDSEEHGSLSADTEHLPEASEDEHAAADIVPEQAEPAEDAKGSSDSLRTLYWQVIHEARVRLKREFPKLSGKEILEKARKECSGFNSFIPFGKQ